MPSSAAVSLSNPYTRVIAGRGLRHTAQITVMWTESSIPQRAADFHPNHFVYLAGTQQADAVQINSTLVTDVTDEATTDVSSLHISHEDTSVTSSFRTLWLKFHLARLDSTRLDTFDFVEPVEPVETSVSDMADDERSCTSLVVFMLLHTQHPICFIK